MLRAFEKQQMLHRIYEINKDALGYDFSPEETASQLAKLSQDSHHFLLGYEDDTSHELVWLYSC